MGSRTAKQLLGVLLAGVCMTILVVPSHVGAQGAQDGPQFGNWGPGMAAPDQEGVDQTPQAGSSTGDQGGAAAPYSSMAPNAVAPAPGVRAYSGCQYDLRGTWWNDGRQTSPSYRTYSAYVYVRQFRSWIQAQQDDGTSYYGQCLGSRLLFDVYNGYQYVGRQSGTISNYGRLYPYPYPLFGDSSDAYAAPAPVIPIGGGGNLRGSFTWSSVYGSGSETWQASAAGYPYGPLPDVLAPTPLPPAPTPVPATATPAPTPVVQSISISALQPAQGPYGTEVVVAGSGFASDNNLITFGPSSGLTHPDGSPANLIARVGSTDGQTVRFTVPRSGPSGILCDPSGSCIGVAAARLQPGSYDVSVSNANGSSNVVSFEITPE